MGRMVGHSISISFRFVYLLSVYVGLEIHIAENNH